MTPFHVKDCGKGVNKDLLPSELAPGLWSDALNIEFSGNFGRRRRGIRAVYTTPTETTYYIQTFNTSASRFLVQAGTDTVFVDDGSTRTDLTPDPAPAGGRDDRWTGGDFNGVLILNNGVDGPWYWGGSTDSDLAALTNWPSGYVADTLRPFREYLVAGAIAHGGTKYPQLLMWSSATEAGSIPSAWTAAATNDAGDDPLSGKGAIIDMLPLGNVNIIYCRSGRVAMRYVGGNEVFAFDPLPGSDGLLNIGCVVEVPSGHVFYTGDDVMFHSGGEANSIADQRVKDWLASNIDSTNAQRAFLAKNPQRGEVWVCFPQTGSTDCDRALVWNWKADTWAIYSLPNVTYACSGIVAASLSTDATWDSDTEAWESDVSSWSQDEYAATGQRLVLATSTPELGLANVGSTDFDVAIEAYRERKGIRPSDEDAMYFIRASRWAFKGVAGAQATVYHGVSSTADGEVSYASAATHTQGASNWVNRMTKRGRYLAVKVESPADQSLELRSYELDIRGGGRF